METYEKLEMEIIRLDARDVIVTSGDDLGGEEEGYTGS